MSAYRVPAALLTLTCGWGYAVAAAAQEIPRDEYLRMLPLSTPRLVMQTPASVALDLFGDVDDPAYRDVDPVDGIDDRRHAVLEALAVRFAPYLVQNTTNVPLNFDVFIDNRDDFALTLDTWDTSDEEARLERSAGINFSVLGSAACPAALRGTALERNPDPSSDPAVEDCKLLELMERYTPGTGLTESRDRSLVHSVPSHFDVLFFNFPGDGEDTWEEAYEPEYERTPEERRASFVHTYVHPFARQLADGTYELLLQYWFFYPTNDSGMDHEGDWEHINVAISPRSRVEGGLDERTVRSILDGSLRADGADPLVMKRIDYYFHEFVWPIDFSSPNVYLPRDEWLEDVENRPRSRFREREMWERIRERAYVDEDESAINTHPLGYIGADNKGLNQALEPPGGSNQEPHGTYPFPGRYNNIGPGGTTDQVARHVDHRDYLRRVAEGTAPAGPTFENREVIGLADPDRIRIVPDWERVVDAAREDPAVRRDWAWLLLPARWGYPATRSPFAGALKHYNTGNVAPQGPSFNSGWNVSGPSSGFHLYEPHELPSIFPLQVQDNFRNDLGFLNLTVPLLLNLPPLDFVARLVSYPFRRAIGAPDPVYYPRDGLPARFVGLSSGVTASRTDAAFRVLAINNEQRDPFIISIVEHLVVNGADSTTANTGTSEFTDSFVGPFGQVAFYVGDRFVSENTVRNIRTSFGMSAEFSNIPEYTYTADLNYWEYSGSLRYNLRTEAFQPFIKGGYGWSWYRLQNVQTSVGPLDPVNSRWSNPGLWPSVWHYGAGIEWVPWRRPGVQGGGLELAFRFEYARFSQTLDLNLDAVPLDELALLFPTLGDVPAQTRAHRNDFVLGLTLSF